MNRNHRFGKSEFCVLGVALAFLCAALLCGCRPSVSAPSPTPSASAAPAVAAASPSVSPTAESFSVLFVNVGRADAAILQFGGRTVLIDTGTAASAPQLFAGLNLLGVSEIDAIFLSHSHSDHIGGLGALAANYPIGMVYSSLLSEKNKNGDGKIVQRCEKLNLSHTELSAGETVEVADGVSFSVLGPLSFNESDDNENSLVLRFTLGETTFLFPGDMESGEENDLLSAGIDLSADVLKVANHGNPDATGDALAQAVSPSVAVISTDTDEDEDSANARVYSALSPAAVYCTQDFTLGVLITLDGDGTPVVSVPVPAHPAAQLSIVSADASTQTVSIRNDDVSTIHLAGYLLYSDRSDAILRFPDDAFLGAGETLTVSAEGGGGDYVFSGEEKPLSKKKKNTITLYDPYGGVLSVFAQ